MLKLLLRLTRDLFALFVQHWDNISTDTERRAVLSLVQSTFVLPVYTTSNSYTQTLVQTRHRWTKCYIPRDLSLAIALIILRLIFADVYTPTQWLMRRGARRPINQLIKKTATIYSCSLLARNVANGRNLARQPFRQRGFINN